MNYWTSIHVSIKGRSHVEKNEPCQDKTFSLSDKKTTVIALSDGAGAYTHSDIGAEIITQVLCKELVANFEDLYKTDLMKLTTIIISTIQKQLQQRAIALGVDCQQFSGTLLFAAINGNRFIAGHIGDGVIGILDRTEVRLLSKPENSEYANVTYFVTSKNAESRLRIYRNTLKEIKGFILMSDGSAASLFNKKENRFGNACKKIFFWLDNYSKEEVRHALNKNFTDFLIKKTFDDCSIAIMKLISVGKRTLPIRVLVFNKDGLDFDLSIKKQFCHNSYCQYFQVVGEDNIRIYSKKKYQIYCNCCKNKTVLTKNSFFSYIQRKEFMLILNAFYDLSKGKDMKEVLRKYKFNKVKLSKFLLRALDFMLELKQTMRDNFDINEKELKQFENICRENINVYNEK